MHEQLNERTNPEGIQHRSDSHIAAEQPTGRDHQDFDARSNKPDGEARSRNESGHQPIARARSHFRTDVEGRRERVHHDAHDQHHRAHSRTVELRQPCERYVDGDCDHHHVAHGAQSWFLAQWNPDEQNTDAGQRGDRAEAERDVVAHTLVKDIPGVETEPSSDHQSHREPVQPQTQVQGNKAQTQLAESGRRRHTEIQLHARKSRLDWSFRKQPVSRQWTLRLNRSYHRQRTRCNFGESGISHCNRRFCVDLRACSTPLICVGITHRTLETVRRPCFALFRGHGTGENHRRMPHLGGSFPDRHFQRRIDPQNRDTVTGWPWIVVFQVGAADLQACDTRVQIADSAGNKCSRLRSAHVDSDSLDLLGSLPMRSARSPRNLANPSCRPAPHRLLPLAAWTGPLVQTQGERCRSSSLQKMTAERRLGFGDIQNDGHRQYIRRIGRIRFSAVASRQHCVTLGQGTPG